jgi:hypothetical protein
MQQTLSALFAIGITSSDADRHTMLVTALHVVEEVLGNDKPIELIKNDGTVISKVIDGFLKIYPIGPPQSDTALIDVPTKEPLCGEASLMPMPLKTMLARGCPIGWLGYPGIALPELCFFHGVVSGYREKPSVYLVDGVAINGVSGGPAFDPQGLVVGFVTSYMPNRVRADTTLPGLMVVTPLNLVRLWMQELLGAQVKSRDSK